MFVTWMVGSSGFGDMVAAVHCCSTDDARLAPARLLNRAMAKGTDGYVIREGGLTVSGVRPRRAFIGFWGMCQHESSWTKVRRLPTYLLSYYEYLGY